MMSSRGTVQLHGQKGRSSRWIYVILVLFCMGISNLYWRWLKREKKSLLLKIAFVSNCSWNLAMLLPRRLFYGVLYPEWTFTFEVVQIIMKTFFKYYGGRLGPIMRSLNDGMEKLVFVPLSSLSLHVHDMRKEIVYVDKVKCEWLRPRTSEASVSEENRSQQVYYLLYLHGGGYGMMSPNSHINFVCRFMKSITKYMSEQKVPTSKSEEIRVETFFVDYRKIPEHSFPAPLDDAMIAYKYLTKKCKICPKRIIIAGDSAGGGLTLSVLLRLRKNNQEMPAAGVLLSPLVDLQPNKDCDSKHDIISHHSIEEIKELYIPGVTDLTLSEASPLYHNLSGLSPLIIQTGDKDLLYPQCLRFASRAQADGAEIVLDIHKNMPHVFCFFPEQILPQSKVGVDTLGKFVAHQLLNEESEEAKISKKSKLSKKIRRNSSSMELDKTNIFDHPPYLKDNGQLEVSSSLEFKKSVSVHKFEFQDLKCA